MSRLDQLTKLRAIDPADPDIPYMLAQEHAKLGDHDAALEAFDACIALDPHYHYAYYHKAKVQEATGDEEAAAATLTEGLARATANSDAKAMGEIQTYLDSIS